MSVPIKQEEPPASPPTPNGRRVSTTSALLIATVAIIATVWSVRAFFGPTEIDPDQGAGDRGVATAFAVPADIDRLIADYEARIADHTDSSDFRILGSLYLEKGRISGDVSRYLAASEAFERAIELNPAHPDAHLGAGSAAYALHDFATSLDQARTVYDATGRIDALAVMADSTLALGDYESARSLLEQLTAAVGDQPSVLVRQAEWARLNGDSAATRTYALEAADLAAESRNPRLRSWYDSFAGQTMLYLGDYEEGSRLAARAVAADPGSHVAVITDARLDTASGRFDDAIVKYESVVDALPEPTYLAELGAIYESLGRTSEADDSFASVDVAASLADAAGVYDRALATSLADRSVEPERAVEIARGELSSREDVGAYDALAWALFAAGFIDEAMEMSEQSIALGTLDARYWYHAGVIAAAAGDTTRAIELLETALELSPAFSPTQAPHAEALLAELR